MSFGLVNVDESIPDACFYITAYAAPDDWTGLERPGSACWHAQGWNDAKLPTLFFNKFGY